MKRYVILPVLSLLLCTSCCTGKNDTPEANAPTAAPSEAAAQAAEMPALVLPYTLELSAKQEADITLLTATVTYHDDLNSAPRMHLDLKGDTELTEGAPDLNLENPVRGQRAVRTFRLRGSAPAADVTVSITDEGFGLEVHESYPPRIAPQALPADITRPLPAPIEIDGNVIEHGVEVTP